MVKEVKDEEFYFKEFSLRGAFNLPHDAERR